MQMTIYDAATVGSRSNCVYPNPVTVTDADTMRQAAAFDHVCAAYKQNYRSVDNFLKADCLPMDCDNDHSDDPDDWLTPFDVAMDFPGVGMIFVYSKSHMKQKGKRGPRPRFHVYFICTETTNSEIYSSWKDRLIVDYPYFDDGAKDSARFLFGVKNAVVEVYDGEITIDEFLADSFAEWDAAQGQIPEGSRNKTMSHYAGRIIKRLGNTEEAHKQFLKEAEKCSPPLDDAELAGIWASAVKFGAKVAAQEGYIPPEQYNQDFLLLPEDFSDVGQAIVLSREYMDCLRFSPATDYIVFNGSFWEESQPNAQGIAQELTARQLEEAETEIQRCIGDALLQKTYTVDFLNKKRVQNKGIVPQYYVENSHEPIIPRDLYMQVQEEMIRRANLHSGANRKKRVYSSKYALSSIVYCSKCGEIYRRIAWNNRGKHSTVWRCCTRVEHGPTACAAPTIQESDLQAAVVQAINLTLGNRENMMVTLQENVEAVIRQEDETSSEGIEAKLMELQKELLKLANSKKDYDSVADEIDRLRELKQNALVESAEREGLKQRIREMREFLEQQSTEVTEYDELLVRRLIEKVTVYDERFEVEFKSGTKVDVER